MTLAERVRTYLDTVGEPIPTTDADRYKARPPWTDAPEAVIPLLREVLPALEEAGL